MVDPDLHGLLIKGPAGSGKSAFIHAFSGAYTGRRARIVPQNITDEQLFGSIDLELILSTGEVQFEPGILGKEKDIVLVDDINLLPRNLSLAMMDSVHSGQIHIEREGLSMTYPCSARIVATANDREQPLASGVNDLFDMCVIIPRDPNSEKRLAVMNSKLSETALEPKIDTELRDRIDEAKKLIGQIKIPDQILEAIVDACDMYGVQGMRGGLSATRVCRASAAIDGRTSITEEDLAFALKVCIIHRRTHLRKETKEVEDRVTFFGDSHMKRFIHDERKELLKKAEADQSGDSAVSDPEGMVEPVKKSEESSSSQDEEPLVLDMEKLFDTIDLLDDSRKKRGPTDNHLKRRFIKDAGKDGRYVSSCPADGMTNDLAVDATVRYAAPYQNHRRKQTGRGGVIIMPSDLRKKVREKHTSCLFFFMVDNSGSLVLRARMRAVKAAIMSMLADHYVRSDSVAVMTFNEEFIGMLLPPTRSVGGVKKVIDDIPTGKKTPLSEALSFMHQYVGQYLRKNPSNVAFVILMTDAGANIAITEGNDPFEEALDIATRVRLDRMEMVLVDTKVSSQPNEKAEKLSYALEAPYYKIEDLRSSDNILRKT